MKLFEATVTFFLLTSDLYLVISQSDGHYADIVFLVDGSQNLARQGFQQIRSFLIKMVNRLDIGIDRYRIGLAQYNGQVHTEFLLNKFQRKDALLSHLKKKYQYKGGPPLNTGRALDYLHKTFFTASAGSRKHEGIPQIAVVITSMRSKDDVTKGADALKNDGIKILSIGVKNSDLQELQTMAFLPNYVFQTKSVNSLPLLSRNITEMVHTVSQTNIILDGPHDFTENNNKERPAVCQSASIADIVFVVDESSSIGKINFQLIRDFLHKLISVLDVGPEKVQIGLLQYSSITRPVFYLNTFQNKPDILRFVQNMLYRGGATYTGEALKQLKRQYLSPSSGSRLNQGVPQIAVVITDGKSQDDVTEAASALRRAGVSVFAFGIKDAVESELRKIASYPAESYVELLQDFDLLKNIQKRIEKKICAEVLQRIAMVPEQTELLHQGCVETEDADIFFLVDGSGSIKPESFQDLKRFLVHIMNIFNIGADQVRVAVVQYADSARMEFKSTQYTHKTELERAIKRIVQIGGGTNTGRALTFMKSIIIDAERSRKTRGRSFLITVTDGKSQDDVINPAVELRQQGVTVYAVGVGDASENELQLIAGADERVFYTANFDALTHIENSIVRDICSKEACSKLDVADIIFLIDGSGSINAKDFLKMKQFISVLVNKTNLGVDKIQIGLVQFSSKPEAEFQLNEHSAKADLFRAIDGVQQMGGHTYTGHALSFTADYFDKARGGRPGVPQYLIVITDGEAQDEVLQPARTIRDKGVSVFAVGVFNANSTQLLEIGGAWDKVHYVESFDLLEEKEQQVAWEICSTHKDWCGAQVADIVFVIDGSESLSASQFNRMKDFMVELVTGSDVAADKVQFGAVLYGDNSQTVFQLDQFTNKDGIQNAINGMNPVGGSTHTAKALNYAKGLLDPVEGGRKQLGVPQFLLLFTAGKLEDKQQLKSAAEVIRNSDINIYAIGVENANKNQLLQIAGLQDNHFYALEFETLGPLMKAMSKKSCDDSKPDCEVHEADVVFLIDGSGSTSASDFKRKKDILKSVVKMFNTGPTKFQFAVVEYSTNPVTIFQLNGTSGQHDHFRRIEKMQQLSQGTMTGKALQFVMDLFQPTTGSRKLQGVPQHLLVITDGQSQDSVVVPANSLRKENINVFAIGVGKADENELLQISGGPEAKIYVEKFAELDQIKSRIVHNLCVPSAEDAAADVVFLVEGTQDIQEFKQIQNFMMGITAELNIGLRKNRIGFSQFGRDVQTEFPLKHYANKKDVWNYIKTSSSFQGGAPLDLRRGIDHLKTTQFIPSAGSRKNEDIPQIAVVITKASSQADVKSHSKVLIQDGVIVISIAASDIVQQQIGLNSSSYPFIFQSLYLDDLHQHSGDVAHMIRNIIKKENQRRQPSVCQSATVADIVYLVDESGSIGETNFELIRNFLVNVINAMDIGPDKVQIGLIQYSSQTTPEFYLNTFQEKSEVLDHIRSVPYRKGGTNTGAAIDYMVQTYFTESRGSRINQGIPQLAVVITDGKSTDDVKVPASALRALGVKVFAFGIKGAVERELQSIASYPASSYVSLIEDFDLLRNVEDQMQKKICNNIVNSLLIKPNQGHIIEQGVHALITVALADAYKVNQIPQIEFGTGFSYKEQLSIGMEAIGDALLKKIKSVAEKQCCNVNCVCTGEPGIHGKPGSYGMEGRRGLPGFSGHPGIDGEEGGRGSPGVTGPRGFMGCEGNRGHKGARGYRGTKGSDGSHGIDGINGEQGEHGEFGLTGEKGKPGYLGKKGLKGDFGDRGVLGIPGDPGTPGISTNREGETGHKGIPGLQGEMGIPGDGGIAGVPGDLGSEGSRGMLGRKGQSGSAGKQGREGDSGIHGPQGEAGTSGPKGRKGGSGSRGQQGTNGILGEDGIHGDPGAKGHPGHAGEPGNKGIREQTGPRGSPGMDGTSIFGSSGVKGRKGGQGVIGNPGLQGEPGKPGQHGKEGSKGARGQRGDAGLPGELGFQGDFGPPGPSGPKGPPGITSMTHCEFVSYIRKNCPCCSKRRGVCPAYPTELVFALDRSSDVTPVLFKRMKGIVINLLHDMNIAESNCPSGARVAVLTYDNEVRSFIRFSDFKRKTLLMKEIEGLRHERSTSKRNIGIGMQFVARNTFKRARNGVLVKKIAVFITNGGSQDTKAVSDAVSHFGALAITPVIISFKDIPDIERVFKNTVVVLPEQQQTSQELLRRVQLCTLCIDVCEPHDECSRFTIPPPLPVNLDIAFVVNDLQRMETAQSETIQHFLNSMVNEFVNSPESKASDLHPRVALVQHRPGSIPRYGKDPFNLEFGVLDYSTKTLKKRHIQDSFSQLEGSSGIGNTIEWSLKNFFSNLTNQQTYKVIFTIFSGETSIDERKLLDISREAKCKGFTMLALALGEVTNVTVLEEFVSFPFDQHLLQLDRALEAEMEYAQRFAVAFLKNMAIGINSYPPAALQRECGGLKSQETVKTRTSADSDRANIMQNMEESKDRIHEVCALNVEEGNCRNYRLKWFFSATEQICKRFWYGGCRGNKNRFDTREECEALCLKSTF
ncbi:LOW QUALITY PROTEIN: collagen alpha-6(VI) chain-like [Scyliorhinus canicula]|uniref:LOW QUALITY PROTEIN: collagen alpha-6(VI) chain-like n=1 Tax=Scyliorhinus canicula TaxID=7830 RepID=UPI0018F5C964|nr:LOW QUALITY PROTEIN: collagen alpha-6(VI) chain-like [Scyliorhinus canicula]